MAISRPFLLALLGVALLGATVFAVQSSREDASGDGAAPAARPQVSEQPAAPAASRPEDVVAGSLDQLESASFHGTLAARGLDQAGSIAVDGAFESPAEGKVPTFEFSLETTAPGSTLDVGMVSLGERAYLTQGDKAYRVPQRAWSQVVKAARENKSAVELPVAVNPRNWLRDVKSEGSTTIDGVETSHVSASLDVASMLSDSLGLAKAAGAPGAELPPQVQGRLERFVKRAQLDVYVGKRDEVLRRARADVRIAAPSGQAIGLTAGLDLTDVNEAQRIEAPKNVVEGVPSGAAGRFAEGLLQGLSGSRGGDVKSLAALATDNPRKAARALAANRKLVIFFRNPRGLDDRAVARAVRAVDRDTKAVVLTDVVAAVESYGKLVEDLGVSQTPSIVLVDSRGKARLIEGFVDQESLTQAVADAR